MFTKIDSAHTLVNVFIGLLSSFFVVYANDQKWIEPEDEKTNKMTRAPSEDSD